MNQTSRSICPSCGKETLEAVEMMPFDKHDPFLPARSQARFLMFECDHCMWQGSTTTLNVV